MSSFKSSENIQKKEGGPYRSVLVNQMDERIVAYLVLDPNTQDRKVSAKSVTMLATALCKNSSGYRELLLMSDPSENNVFSLSDLPLC